MNGQRAGTQSATELFLWPEDALNLMKMIEVMAGNESHDVLDGFLVALRMHALPGVDTRLRKNAECL